MRATRWGGLVFVLAGLSACPSDSDTAGEKCDNQAAAYQQFVASHARCDVALDCVIVGGCSQTFGFQAVSVSARDRAQQLSEAPMGCGLFDGPTYVTDCVQGRCTLKPSGRYCGQPTDSGVHARAVSGADSGLDAALAR